VDLSALDPTKSWWRKITRAHKHLRDFNEVAGEYVATNPYRMCKRFEGQGKRRRCVHRLEIDPAPDVLALIAGDFLFNVRSALDHITVASAHRKCRYAVSFPIFTDDIWERDGNGTYLERHADARDTWHRITGGVNAKALAIIKGAQPYNAQTSDPAGIGVKNHVLALLSSYQNADKHRELAIVGGHLAPSRIVYVTDDGQRFAQTDPDVLNVLLEHDAEVESLPGIDPGTVNMEIGGTVEVLIGREGTIRATDTWLKASTTFHDLMGFTINRVLLPLGELLK
jgi:hypothetical protein